ncbi:MAG: pyridoxamine 5'-phosphate oxidase family protein [Acidimicrobiia bacterium]
MTAEPDGRAGLEVLDRDECLTLIGGCSLGRVAGVVDGMPLIFPVNLLLDGHVVVFRNDPGTKVHGARNGPVAFECDEPDSLYHTGWSVVVAGDSIEVRDPAERDRLRRLPRVRGCPGPKAIWLRIQPRTVTGRRVPRSHGQQAERVT